MKFSNVDLKSATLHSTAGYFVYCLDSRSQVQPLLGAGGLYVCASSTKGADSVTSPICG
jgi:hypothetical protein